MDFETDFKLTLCRQLKLKQVSSIMSAYDDKKPVFLNTNYKGVWSRHFCPNNKGYIPFKELVGLKFLYIFDLIGKTIFDLLGNN